MQLNTKHFGELEIDEKGITYFNKGVPGFESVRKFILLEGEDPDSPFKWLQCVDNPNLAFTIVDPFAIRKDYDFEISDETVEELGIKSPEDIIVFSIVVIPEDISKMTMNLKAPVVMNTKNNKGMQVILDTDRYTVRHYILEELQKQEVVENACPDTQKGTVDCNR